MQTATWENPQIYVERKMLGVSYAMPTMKMDREYYEIGYIISGDRKTITPTQTYYCGPGTVGLTPPYIYHRTMATSDEPYERILVKFTLNFVKPFIQEMGQQVFDQLYEEKIYHFTEDVQKKLFHIFAEMVEEFEKNGAHKEFILQGMLFRLLNTVYEEKLPTSNVTRNVTPLTPPIMDAIVFIENNYAKNPTLEEAAQVAGFSTAYFSRLFSAQLGKSYTDYLDNVKIRHAQILLTQTKKSIMEIAEEVGYCHGNYLNSQFKKKVGMTPGEYRKRNRK
ncbi:MAG: AraC family transcriptional regulator [Roseburia sp.]|nr:AraC family transcriptional regulator [Roseburia sp.]